MRFSFVVTSWNIEALIRPCLDSLRGAVRPGDQVIVVDDGSTDLTPERIQRFAAAGGYGPEVALVPVLLGTRTPGGVGTAANIGMAEAQGEALVFVDGDDLLLAEGFRAARQAFETGRPDLLVANHRERIEPGGTERPAADGAAWARIATRGLDRGVVRGAAARQAALALIGVPWRKIYRRALLAEHGLRFPEGEFRYEDNPFHWAVCLAAESFRFLDRPVALHRLGRPGQSMAETGAGLAAFFGHYRRIEALLAGLPADAPERLLAAEWLLENMTWQLERIAPAALWDYAAAAAPVLKGLAPGLWQRLAEGRFRGSPALAAADQLRQGEPVAVLALWQAQRAAAGVAALAAQVAALAAEGAEQKRLLRMLAAIREFEALRALDGPAAEPPRGA